MTTKRPDWEAIERAYRAGMFSVRAIAETHHVNEGTIRNRAKRHGWLRDLTEQVRHATQEKLSRSALRADITQREAGKATDGEGLRDFTHQTLRTPVTHSEVRKDDQIIDEASDEAVSVVLGHRNDLAQWRRIANKLRNALSGVDVTTDNHGDFARSLNAGVDAQLKVIKGERQAYSLDTGDGKDPESAARPKDLPTDPIEAARAYQAFMLGG